MTKLLELSVKNVFPFKEATLDLDYDGITVIKGLNKDDGPKASNAAGKSRLVASLPDLVLDETPTGKDDKKASAGKKKTKRKQMVRVRLQKGKHEYTITKTSGKSGKSYEILQDGKTTNIRGVKYSIEKVQSLFNITSDDQFYTRLYLDGTIPHPLIVGSASTRQEYVVDLFDLKNIDNVRKLLNAELTAVSKKTIEYRSVKKTLDALRVDLMPKEERQSVRSRLDTLKQKQERLSKDLQESQRISQLLTFEQQNAKLLKRYHRLRAFGTVDPHESLKKVSGQIADLNIAREAHEEWSHYDKDRKLWSESYAPVKSLLSRIGCDEKEVKSKVREFHSMESVLEAKRALVKDPGVKPEEVPEPKHSHEECKLKVHQFRQELDHAKNFKHGRCPMCGSQVKARTVDDIKSDLARWVKRINQCEAYERYQTKTKEWKNKWNEEKAFKEQVAELETKRTGLKTHLKVYSLLDKVREKPVKPIVPRTDIWNPDRLEKLRSKKELLKQLQEVWDNIVELESIKPADREKAQDAQRHVVRLNKTMAEVSELTIKIAKQEEIVHRLRDLKTRALDLKSECKDEKLLKALVNAYSTSGLKKFMIERYSKILEQQVNKYRKMFFSEDYEFEFRYESGLKVLVHRHYGKRIESSDVRKLSGAEKRFFSLLLLVATNTMLPAKKRCNVLILDEPESQMGPPAIDRFIRTLEILNKLVPHIIIVTPKTDLNIPGSRGFTVVKHHGMSKLVSDKSKA